MPVHVYTFLPSVTCKAFSVMKAESCQFILPVMPFITVEIHIFIFNLMNYLLLTR